MPAFLRTFPLLSSRFLQPRRKIYQAAASVLTGLALALVYFTTSTLLQSLAETGFPGLQPYLPVVLAVGLAALVPLVYSSALALVTGVDRSDALAMEQKLELHRAALTHLTRLDDVSQLLYADLHEMFQPSVVHLFLYDPETDQYTAASKEQGIATTDLRFPAHGPLAETLDRMDTPWLPGDFGALPGEYEHDQVRIRLLGAVLYAPLRGAGRLAGWAAFGPRRNGKPYTLSERLYIQRFCDQAATALERAQTLRKAEHRLREMDALVRLAQGVNITPRLDDLLELVVTQTARIFQARDLQISLWDDKHTHLLQIFALHDGKRMTEPEGLPLPPHHGLDYAIAAARTPLRADDYTQLCQAHGVAPALAGIYSYLGVPLNAGLDTIGALSLGSRDPMVLFTQDNLDLLQAIADQTAGAIARARLLDETQRRARQLGTVIEITRQMTSTLDLGPLLRSILDSAVQLLDCEAGSLLLLDPLTGELEFRVVTGPVAQSLVGTRLPPYAGLAGKALKTRQPVIVDDAHTAPEWFAVPDRKTGFVTRALLVTPMELKDKPIGVLEVINKRDQSPFTDEDLTLLLAFAGQAAVAIENARQYTNTDQALEERMEEIAALQRLDRELAVSPDLLAQWAAIADSAGRLCGVEATWVGTLESGSFTPLTSAGQRQPGRGALCPPVLAPHLAWLERAISTGQAQQTAVEGDQWLVAVPLHRAPGGKTLLILHGRRSALLSEERLAFLTRWMDHATLSLAARQPPRLPAGSRPLSPAGPGADPLAGAQHALAALRQAVEAAPAAAEPLRTLAAEAALALANYEVLTGAALDGPAWDFQPLPAAELLRSFSAEAAVLAPGVAITIDPQQMDALPLLWADPIRVRQALLNLLRAASPGQPAAQARITAGENPEHSGQVSLVLQVEPGPAAPAAAILPAGQPAALDAAQMILAQHGGCLDSAAQADGRFEFTLTLPTTNHAKDGA